MKPLISQGFQVSVSILVTQHVLRDQFRYTLKIGKNESWSDKEMFQRLILSILSHLQGAESVEDIL